MGKANCSYKIYRDIQYIKNAFIENKFVYIIYVILNFSAR